MLAPYIQDSRLRSEFVFCLLYDYECSPKMDHVRHVTGIEYEYILQQQLAARGVGVETENELRLGGHAKTPDVRVVVPIAVKVGDKVSWSCRDVFSCLVVHTFSSHVVYSPFLFIHYLPLFIYSST